MALEVDPPPPPTIVPPGTVEEGSGGDDDYRRAELESYLEGGAWEEAFSMWAADTDMTEEEFHIALDLDLFDRFDFFWDDFAGRVGYSAPGIAEDWKETGYHDDLANWGQVSSINAGMAELGQLICDHLLENYLEVEDDEPEDLDLPDY